MMHWKRFLLPAIVSLAVPLTAVADSTTPSASSDKKPCAGTTTPVSAGCTGGCGASGGCGKEGHRGRLGLLRGLFQFLEDTNEVPEFRKRGSFCGGQVGGKISGGSRANTGLGMANGRTGRGFMQPPFQAAPWYVYWPYDSHFQMPAPISAPYYPPQAYGYPGTANPYFGTAPVMAPGYGYGQEYGPQDGYGYPPRGGHGYPPPGAPTMRGGFAPSITPMPEKK